MGLNRRLFWEVAFIVFAAALTVRIVVWQAGQVLDQERDHTHWMLLEWR